MLSCYLAGPISGKVYKEASSWRDKAEATLTREGFTVYNPLRGKSFLSSKQHSSILSAPFEPVELSDRAIRKRDKMDVINSDIILINLMDATEVSIGTVGEIFWAEDRNKLIVIAMPENDTIHNHPFIRDVAIIFPSLKEALNYVLNCNP